MTQCAGFHLRNSRTAGAFAKGGVPGEEPRLEGGEVHLNFFARIGFEVPGAGIWMPWAELV